MPDGTVAYLVVHRDDGFGDVYPLAAGQRYTLGRAATNRIVLKDDLCSREHAEVCQVDGRWRLRDLGSLNGTRVNDQRLNGDCLLSVADEVHLGRTQLLFVDDMNQLPDFPERPAPAEEAVSIKKRLGQTRFLTPLPPDTQPTDDTLPGSRHHLSRDLSLLYRLALEMGSAASYTELVPIVLNGLLEAIPADVGAILTVKDGRDLEVAAHRQRDPNVRTYHKVSKFVSSEVMASREAVLVQ